MPSKGLSTDLAPIQVRITKIEIKNQYFAFLEGLNFAGLVFEAIKVIVMRMDAAKAITPPSFEGIDRRIT